MTLPNLSDQPELGAGVHPGIGMVGAGGIVESAPLPAYQKSKFRVTGIFELSGDRASQLAQRYSLAKVYCSLEGCICGAHGRTHGCRSHQHGM